MWPPKFSDCIEACNLARRRCERLVTAGLAQRDVNAVAATIGIARGSRPDDPTSKYAPLCDVCARACEELAKACDKHAQIEAFSRCGEAFRKCAEECAKLAKLKKTAKR